VSGQTTYRVELASGVWLLLADGDCIADADGHEEWSLDEAADWASDVVQTTRQVWIDRESWDEDESGLTATVEDATVDDDADRLDDRRRYLLGEDPFDDPRLRDPFEDPMERFDDQ
jgi:hypothetical protein